MLRFHFPQQKIPIPPQNKIKNKSNCYFFYGEKIESGGGGRRGAGASAVQPYGRAAMAVPAASEGKPKAVRDSLRACSASAAQEDAEA